MRSGMNIFNFMRSSRSRRKKAPLHYVTPQSAGRRRSRSYRVGVLYLLFALIAVGAAFGLKLPDQATLARSEEHTSELQSLMRISYAVFCLQKTNKNTHNYLKNYSRV